MCLLDHRSVLARLLFFSSATTESPQIRCQGMLDLVSGSDKLYVQNYDFLQVCLGGTSGQAFSVCDGVDDFWERLQKPYITDKATSHLDQQGMLAGNCSLGRQRTIPLESRAHAISCSSRSTSSTRSTKSSSTFTCRNNIFEMIMVSQPNDAAMFRQSNSTSAASAGPPHNPAGAACYAQHLPFQVFCCKSGTHVVDHAQTYYTGLRYCAGAQVTNLSTTDDTRRLGREHELNFNAMPDTGEGEADDAATGEDNVLANAFYIPNSVFRAAWILVNLWCVTTYAEDDGPGSREKYVLDDWEGAAKSFVCQEQRIPEAGKHPKRRGD
ncbi:hypothetical protein DFH11DRAFT_1748332 [Phellopilus nigrolimitatus]|nr:hypothetical protein DFH11DRAFT_1748332 [Phellopilus nigrolimitatus]